MAHLAKCRPLELLSHSAHLFFEQARTMCFAHQQVSRLALGRLKHSECKKHRHLPLTQYFPYNIRPNCEKSCIFVGNNRKVIEIDNKKRYAFLSQKT